MSSERDPAYLLDMLIAARRIQTYIEGVDRATFEQDSMLQDAVLRRLEIMGEAARRVSQAFKDAHPDIPWRDLIGTRNILIHQYDRVNFDIIWDTVQNDLPALIDQLAPLVPPDDDAPGDNTA